MSEQPHPRLPENEVYVPEAITEEPHPEDVEINSWLRDYNLRLDNEGYLHYNQPHPPAQGTVPEFATALPEMPLFDHEDNQWLSQLITKRFSARGEREKVLKLVNLVFASITGREMNDFAHIIIMSNEHFTAFKKKVFGESPKGEADGVNFGGLIIVRDTGSNSIIPLLFHELGHSFYPKSDNEYENELQAYYFQELCYTLLQSELERIGIRLEAMKQRPVSEAHQQGLIDAVKLVNLLKPESEAHWKETEHYEAYLQEKERLLKIVGQAKKALQS